MMLWLGVPPPPPPPILTWVLTWMGVPLHWEGWGSPLERMGYPLPIKKDGVPPPSARWEYPLKSWTDTRL